MVQPIHIELVDVYSPETVRELRVALEASWNVLSVNHSPLTSEALREETREMLARRLLKRASHGEKNQARLVTYALGSAL